MDLWVILMFVVFGAFLAAMVMAGISEARRDREEDRQQEERDQWRKLERDIEAMKRLGPDARTDANWLKGHMKLAENPNRWLEL